MREIDVNDAGLLWRHWLTMLRPMLARRAWMHACRFAAAWAGAALVFTGLRGADHADAQPGLQVTGCPSFHEVHPDTSAEETLRSGVPPGFKIYDGIEGRAGTQLLRTSPIVSGNDIAEAWADLSYSMKDQWVVRFRFDAPATRRFGDFTTRNIHQRFAIVLDGRAISVLWIMEPILRGVGQIDGGFTADEARQLAERINSGGCRS
jgi:preprotein translocase subunit SecD